MDVEERCGPKRQEMVCLAPCKTEFIAEPQKHCIGIRYSLQLIVDIQNKCAGGSDVVELDCVSPCDALQGQGC